MSGEENLAKRLVRVARFIDESEELLRKHAWIDEADALRSAGDNVWTVVYELQQISIEA
jgi:hypothetical protein